MPWIAEEATEEVNTLPVNTEQSPDVALPPTLEPVKPISSWVEEETPTVSSNWIEEEEPVSSPTSWVEESPEPSTATSLPTIQHPIDKIFGKENVSEYVSRPLARIGRNVLGGAAETTKLATQGFTWATGEAAKALTDDEVSKSMIDARMQQYLNDSPLEAFDSLTKGFTAPRNSTEKVTDTAMQFLAPAGTANVLTKGITKASEKGIEVASKGLANILEKGTVKTGSEAIGTASMGAAFEISQEAFPDNIAAQVLVPFTAYAIGKGSSDAVVAATRRLNPVTMVDDAIKPFATSAQEQGVIDSVRKELSSYITSDKYAYDIVNGNEKEFVSTVKNQLENSGLEKARVKQLTYGLVKEFKYAPDIDYYSKLYNEPRNTIVDLTDNSFTSVIQEQGVELGAGKGFTAKKYTKWIQEMGPLVTLERALVKTGQIDAGSGDIMEKSVIRVAKNVSQQGSTQARSWIGDGVEKGVLRSGIGSELIPDTSIKNITQFYQDAITQGATKEDVDKFQYALDTIDDHLTWKARAAELNKTADDIINSADSKLTEAERFKQIQNAEEMRKEAKDLLSYKSRMPEEEAIALKDSYLKNTKWASQLQKDVADFNSFVLDELVASNNITKETADFYKTIRPGYTPAYKRIEDITNGVTSEKSPKFFSRSKQLFKARSGSGKPTEDALDTRITYAINAAQNIQRNKINTNLLNFFTKLSDEDFGFIFREKKEDVMRVLRELPDKKTKKYMPEDITPFDTDAPIKTGLTSIFNIGGKKVELTLRDADIAEILGNSGKSVTTGQGKDYLRMWANFSRYAITTFDPMFTIRAAQREAQDFMVTSKATPFKDYIPIWDNIKSMFSVKTNPELYKYVSANYGLNSPYGANLPFSKEELLKEANKIATNGPTNNVVSYFGGKLNTISESGDLGNRILQYQIARKNGLDHDAAMILARDVGLNFTQKGNAQGLNKVLAVVPFARSWVSGMDKVIRGLKYEPERVAKYFLLGVYGPYKALEAYNRQWKDTDGVPFVDKLDPKLKGNYMPVYGPWSKSVNDHAKWHAGWVYGKALTPVDQGFLYMSQQVDKVLNFTASHIEKNPELKAELARNKVTGLEVVNAAAGYLTSNFAPPMTIPGLSTAYQLDTNLEMLSGRKIYTDAKDLAQRKLLPKDDWGDETPAVVRDFASYLYYEHKIDMNPRKANFALQNTFFSMYTYGVALADTIYNQIGVGPEKPEPRTKDIPVIKGFVGDIGGPEQYGTSNAYYNMRDYVLPKLDEVEALEAAIEKGTDPEDVKKAQDKLAVILAENDRELMYAEEFKKTDEAIKAIRDENTAISKNNMVDSSTPGRELFGEPKKRKKLNDNIRQIESLQRELVDSIRKDNEAEEVYFRRFKQEGQLQYGIVSGAKSIQDLFSKDEKKVDLPPVTLPNATEPRKDKAPTLDFFDSLNK